MKFKIEDGYLSITYKDKELLINILNEWRQLFSKYNWYTMTIINLYIENDAMMGAYDFEFVILGIGIRFRLNYKETETMKEIGVEIKKLLKE